MIATDPPLIVTARLDARSTAWFDARRRRWFPAERLVVGAHLTLFHHLRGDREVDVLVAIEHEASHCAPLAAVVAAPRSLGGGVAYDLECERLVEMRRRLASRWPDELTPQDRTWRRPHITVQNKVPAATARATLDELRTERRPRVTIEGLELWRYRGGPWEPVATALFAGTVPSCSAASE